MQPSISKNSKVAGYRFGVDFQSVETIPDDPRNRLEYFTLFKELLKQEWEKIKAWHRSGVGGREVIQAHTGLIDEVIKRVMLSLSALKRYEGIPVMDEFSLVAVGGYGRGELNPCSDIDLLFLLRGKISPGTDQFIQEALSVLWGFGLELGHSCRTIKDCVKLAKDDITIKTSMLGTRYLAGNYDLFEALRHAIATSVLKKDTKEFLDSKLKERYAGFWEGVACHAEPDIKNGPGGLRDYHVALWAVAVCFGVLSFREIGREEMISDQELDVLDHAVDFSLRVRNELHYLMNKKSDVLTLDIQKELAANLRYDEKGEVPPVERFMRDYFFQATNIYNFSEMIFERCRESKRSIRKTISSFQARDLGNGFYARNSLLTVKGNAEVLFRDNKMLLLELFKLCRDHNIDLDTGVKRQIRLHADLIDAEFLSDGRVREFLFALLDHCSERVLRLMHGVGVLGKILPEFGQTHCVVYYDFYHRYTADEHSLRMVRFLEELDGGLEELASLYAVVNKGDTGFGGGRWLKLASLLSSLRNRGGSAEPRKKWDSLPVFERLRLAPDQAETVHFLIENLYEMIETAFHQDIHQPDVVKSFARKVNTVERLNLLYLISYAELRAVAPDTWTAWKKNLLSELYHRAKNYLDRPESLLEKPGDTREEVCRVLEGEFTRAEIEHHLTLMPDDYLVTTYSGEVAEHMRLIRALAGDASAAASGGDAFVLRHSDNETGGYHNLVLCCPNGVETFKKIVGSLTTKNINILGAQIYLRKDNIVIITIQAEGADAVDLKNPKTLAAIENTLREVLGNGKDLSELFKSRMRYVEKKRFLPIIPKIQIDNSPASAYTIVRVEARDHLGMLYKIAKVLADLGIQIHRAKISCMGGRGIDVFYVSQRDQKIIFEPLLRRIKENMINVLLVEKMEDIG